MPAVGIRSAQQSSYGGIQPAIRRNPEWQAPHERVATLTRRALCVVKHVISDAHEGLKAAGRP